MLRAGDRLGRYTLIKKLGSGAFGTVWLGERRTAIISTMVALKISLDYDVNLEIIKQEADVWVRASGHPNVLPIIEADIYDDRLVMASEYAPDGSLEAWLKQNDGKSPSIGATVDVISGILAGLEHLHARGIIHRDLKPANILFQGDVPRLADFGISRALSATHSGVIAGTLCYMAPEAFDGVRNERTDIWSVGIILYQLLTGQLPFPQRDIASLMKAIIHQPHVDPVRFVPVFLHAIVRRALSKDPQQRYGSAAEMRADVKSHRVMFELMIQPEGVPSTSSVPTNHKTKAVTEEGEAPRVQHYRFAHVYFRERVMSAPRAMVSNLEGESGVRRLRFYWMSDALAVRPFGEEFIEADGLDCFPVWFSEQHYGVIVKLPRPERMTEAFFVAIILRDTGEDAQVSCRYITLELSKNDDGTGRTALCEWVKGSHFNYGSGPLPEAEAFTTAVRELVLSRLAR